MKGTLVFAACLTLVAASAASAQAVATTHARGTFDVATTPQTVADSGARTLLGRYSLTKQFRGDLDGTSTAEMLTGGNVSTGSAGYVAMELVTGTIGGRRGTFVLQHSGTLTRGTAQLTIRVVPESGTGQLAGISGSMSITITNGVHYYDFEYAIGSP